MNRRNRNINRNNRDLNRRNRLDRYINRRNTRIVKDSWESINEHEE